MLVMMTSTSPSTMSTDTRMCTFMNLGCTAKNATVPGSTGVCRAQ